MNLRLSMLILGLLVLVRPALAETNGLALAGIGISPELGNSLVDQDACFTNPYASYWQTCVNDDLNVSLDESEPRITIVDQIAMLIYTYKDLRLHTKLRPNTKLTFTVGLLSLYERETKAQLELRIRF
jgi:hypothetical protein